MKALTFKVHICKEAFLVCLNVQIMSKETSCQSNRKDKEKFIQPIKR